MAEKAVQSIDNVFEVSAEPRAIKEGERSVRELFAKGTIFREGVQVDTADIIGRSISVSASASVGRVTMFSNTPGGSREHFRENGVLRISSKNIDTVERKSAQLASHRCSWAHTEEI